MVWMSAHINNSFLSEHASPRCRRQPLLTIGKLNLHRLVSRFKNVSGLKVSSETFSAVLCGEQQHINPNIKQTNQPKNFFRRKASTKANHAKAWDAKLRPTRYARPSQTCRKAGTQNHGSFLFGLRNLFLKGAFFFARIRILIEAKKRFSSLAMPFVQGALSFAWSRIWTQTKNNRSVVKCKDSRVAVGGPDGGRVTRCTSLGGAFL